MSFASRCVFFAVIAVTAAAPEVLVNENPELSPVQRLLTRPSPECAPPFESFGGMCLLLNAKWVLWPQAEAFCSDKGGHLVWMADADESYVIRKFARSKRTSYFWIGLHRKNDSSLGWSSGSESAYRGAGLRSRERRLFKPWSVLG